MWYCSCIPCRSLFKLQCDYENKEAKSYIVTSQMLHKVISSPFVERKNEQQNFFFVKEFFKSFLLESKLLLVTCPVFFYDKESHTGFLFDRDCNFLLCKKSVSKVEVRTGGCNFCLYCSCIATSIGTRES